MARRPVSVIDLCGLGAAIFIIALSFGSVVALLTRASGQFTLQPYDLDVVVFTLWQAALSAGLSVFFAVFLARALMRRRFWGRHTLILLLGAPFILPIIVAVLGLMAVFGNSGFVSYLLNSVGLPPLSIYGLHGILIAHVFFNLPLATRLILQGWQDIPNDRFRLAQSLQFTPWQNFRHIEWPMLSQRLAPIFATIFIICTTSFAIALTFGGGPKATTIELAIYEAFRFEFNLTRASIFALFQLSLGIVAGFAAMRFVTKMSSITQLSNLCPNIEAPVGIARLIDVTIILLSAAFIILPMVSLLSHVMHIVDLPVSVYRASLNSILTALGSTALVAVLAIALCASVARFPFLQTIGYMVISMSSLVMGIGLFIMIWPLTDPSRLALLITLIVNAILSLPFVMATILPAMVSTDTRYGRLCESLNMSAWEKLWLVTLPQIRRPLGYALGLSAALSMGDLGVIALFGAGDQITLPLQIYRLMEAYKMELAQAASALLLIICLIFFYVFERLGAWNAGSR